MKKLRFTQNTFEVSDVVMSVLKEGLHLQFLKGRYPSMELYAGKRNLDYNTEWFITESYGKLICDAVDLRRHDNGGGKSFSIRFMLRRVQSECIGYGLPRYEIHVWYRKDSDKETFRESFHYNLWSHKIKSSIKIMRPEEVLDLEVGESPPIMIAF
jgi:hypothetical protein